MTLKKLQLRAGVNRENTVYASENGWYDCDKIRFRQGTPEKIGGWYRTSDNTFTGICRSLFSWITLTGVPYTAVGTHLKYYVYTDQTYYDVTPLRTFATTATLTNPFTTTLASKTVTVAWTAHGMQTGDLTYFTGATATGGIPAAELNTRHVVTVTGANSFTITVEATAATSATTGGGTVAARSVIYGPTLSSNPFATTSGSAIVTVTHTAHGASIGDFVTFSGATTVNGLTLNNQYQVTAVVDVNSYRITAASNASGTGSGGGSAVVAKYQIPVGAETNSPSSGWGAGAWGTGVWGTGGTATAEARLWSQFNFGEDLIFNPRYGGLYYWDSSVGVTDRAVELNTLPGASDVPTRTHLVTVSDVSRFVMAFGCNDYGSATIDNLLIRWSDQEDPTNWTPAATNQAGSLRLSHGSEIIAVMQARQELLVWTNTSLYSLKYVGAPIVWQADLLGDNISCPSPNGVAYAGSTMYWMGADKFYRYDSAVQTLSCDLRSYVFSDINTDQPYLTFAGTNEGFSEIWWFYPSGNSAVVDRYVVFNYLENVWYYGTMNRTAWLDTGLYAYPIGATPNGRLVYHEYGVDNYEFTEPAAIPAYVESAEFDIDDGDHFGFIWRVLPDVTFRNSTSAAPRLTMTLYPRKNSGAARNNPLSVGGNSSAPVVRGEVVVPVEQFTGQVPIRVRGRQMAMRIESTELGTTWQLGFPRIDLKQDGRRG